MEVLINQARRVSLPKDFEKWLGFKWVLFFLLSWLIVYNEMPLPVRMVLVLIFVAVQFTSYINAACVFLIATFIPFYNELVMGGVPMLTATRLLFFPFLILSINRPMIRKLQINRHMLFIILFSIFSLKITSDILYIVQEVPLSTGQTESYSVKNAFASYLDIFAILSFFYFAYTRLTFYEIKKLFNFILLFAFLEAIALLFLVYKNPHVVMDHAVLQGAAFDQTLLWRNPFFGHKNEWGMMLMFLTLATVVILLTKRKEVKSFWYIVGMAGFLAAIAISLSRQAYVWTFIGTVALIAGTRNYKYFIYMIALLGVIGITQPKFIMDRMESMLTARSSEDFKELNRKVSDQARVQAVKNFQVLPRMFFSEWEYNYSEGFWNGMLHQQGILGMAFQIYIYIFIFLRYYALYQHKHKKLRYYALFGMILVFLMFFANFNRRSTHFLHYKGYFTQINFILIFMFLYIELIYYAVKNKINDIKYL